MNKNNFKAEIIDYIRRNRVSSTEVADCLGKTGAIENVASVNRGHFVVGIIHWAYAFRESNWHLHKLIQEVESDSIIFVEDFECNGRAIFGDIVSKYLMLYCQAQGIITTGKLRDAGRLIKENWPIWCKGFSPVGCFNTKPKDSLEDAIKKHSHEKYNGSIAVCDDTGVVIIEKDFHTQDFLEKLKLIEEQEDIWYECIDRKKWTTFKTICQKSYLDPSDK